MKIDDEMRPYAIASAVLHVAVIALLVLGLPPSQSLDLPGSIPIDIVQIGPETGPSRVDKGTPSAQPPKPVTEAKPTPPAPPPPQDEPPPAAPPQPVIPPTPPKLAQTPPQPRDTNPPPRPTPPPEPDAVPTQKPKPPEPKPEPKPEPEPPKPEPPKKPDPKPEPPKPPEPPKVEPKPEPPKPPVSKPEPPREAKVEPKPPPKEPPKDQLSSLLDNVLKDAPKTTPSQQAAKPSTAAPSSNGPSGAAKATQGPDKPFVPSGRTIEAVRSQVGEHWNIDTGTRNGNQTFTLRVEVSRDYKVLNVWLDDKDLARYNSDRPFRAAVDAGVRALHIAGQLKLPPEEFPQERYADWRIFVFNFDPKDM